METKKQEAIRLAYGEYWENISNHHLYDGWINQWAWDFKINLEMEELNEINTPKLIRPKSLQGIQDNNGWISINSEEDLPKRDNNLWLHFEDGSIILGKWCIFKKVFLTPYGENFDNDGKFTHYQPIIKPEKPLY